jgi:hypothetical protein
VGLPHQTGQIDEPRHETAINGALSGRSRPEASGSRMNVDELEPRFGILTIPVRAVRPNNGMPIAIKPRR